MYLPNIYQKFAEKYPAVFKNYNQLGTTCREAGSLDTKVQNLVKLGIAMGCNSRGGVMSHARKALAAGVTPEEIFHAVLLSLTTIGFPNMMAAMSWVNEVVEEQLKNN